MTQTVAKKLTDKERAELAKGYAIIMGEEELPAAADPEVISRAILERIMEAETYDEVFAPQTLRSWQELVGVPVRITDFRFNRSTKQGENGGGSPVYAVVDVELLDGSDSKTTVTCGGRNVLVQMLKAKELGVLDRPVALIAKPTAEGNTVLWLEAADNPLDGV